MTGKPNPPKKAENDTAQTPPKPARAPQPEIGGRGGLDPVRYGDWEIGGKCVDF